MNTDVTTTTVLISLSGLNCTGEEEKLINCEQKKVGDHGCTVLQVAGLYCGGV